MPAKIIDMPEVGPLKLYKRKGARSIRLSVSAKGEVRVTMPHWTPYSVGARFASSKRDWIRQQLASHQTNQLLHRQPVGKNHTLFLVPDATTLQPVTRVSDSIIRVQYPPSLQAADADVQAAAVKASVRALRNQAEDQLPGRLSGLAEAHGFNYRSVAVKQLTGRWGSCDSSQNIILNLYLMQLPWTLIDYVLMHELTHTEVMRHGPDFWGMMQEHMSDVKVRRLAIRQHRPVVMGGMPVA